MPFYALALLALLPVPSSMGSIPSWNVERKLPAFSRLPSLERFDVPIMKFESMQETLKLGTAAILTGISSHPEAKKWRAWERWKIDNLRKVNDYFSSVQIHAKGKGSTFYDLGRNNTLGIRGLNPNVYHQRTVEDFFQCSGTEFPYVPGGSHPTFDPDILPRAHFTFPEDHLTHENFYWACGGTNTYSHYDKEHVFLIQISGSKELLINPPSEINAMHLQPALHPSHRQTQMPCSPCQPPLDVEKFPLLKNLKTYALVKLEAGNALYLPPLWMHSVCNLTPSTAVSIKGLTRDLLTDSILTEAIRGVTMVGGKHRKESKKKHGNNAAEIEGIRRATGAATTESASILLVYQYVIQLLLVAKPRVPSQWIRGRKSSRGEGTMHAEGLFLIVYSRYQPHAGKFQDDEDVAIPCTYLSSWRNSHAKDVGGITPAARSPYLAGLARRMRKQLKGMSFYELLVKLGRYGAENEVQDAIEYMLEHAVGGSRVNAALRAINKCLSSEMGAATAAESSSTEEDNHTTSPVPSSVEDVTLNDDL